MRDLFYICTFLSVLVASLMTIFMEGRAVETTRIDRELDSQIVDAQQNSEYSRGKYQTLSEEPDGITVLAAEMKFERARQ